MFVLFTPPGAIYHAFSQKEAEEFDVQVRCLAGSPPRWLLAFSAALGVLFQVLLLTFPVAVLGSLKVCYSVGLFPYAGLLSHRAKVKLG